MDAPITFPLIDTNRGLRDRLADSAAAGASVDRAVELTLAVKDLQELAKSRLAPEPSAVLAAARATPRRGRPRRGRSRSLDQCAAGIACIVPTWARAP